jgi:hypothetical protein
MTHVVKKENRENISKIGLYVNHRKQFLYFFFAAVLVGLARLEVLSQSGILENQWNPLVYVS